MLVKTAAAGLLLFACGVAVPAPAQQRPAQDCSDDRGVDRCADDQQRRTRALYGVPSIEENAAAGEEVRRVFYVDGYGGDLILIAFVRAPGRDPEVQVHYPQRDGQGRPEPQRAAVSQPIWAEVARRAAHFDRSFTPRPGAEPSICLHAWVYTIEAAERTRNPRQPMLVRRKVEDACGDGPGQVFARDLEQIALPHFPHCAALDPEQHRNEAAMLDACRMLSGDRLAAAEVLNRARAFRQLRGPQDAQRIAGHFAHETRIDWAGTPYTGSGYRAGDFWIERLGASTYPTNFYVERVEGETSSRVKLTGQLSRSLDTPRGEGTGTETATIEQIWARDINGTLQVEQATIGPWQARPR